MPANVSPRWRTDDAGALSLAARAETMVRPGRHVPALDGIRGLAVAMVLLFHFVGGTVPTNGIEQVVVGVTKYGAYGVELFFILSGFLITGILYDARNEPNYFRNFYMRRVLRIFPLYYGVLVLLFVVLPLVPWLRGPAYDELLNNQAWAWLYAVNIHIALHGDWSLTYLNHFWSLAVEEHFYFFWPLIVFLLSPRPRVIIAVCLAVASCAILGRFGGALAGLSWWTTYVLTPFRLDGLALGAFLAVMVRQPGGWDRLVRVLPWVAGIAAALVMVSFGWTHLVSRKGLELVMTARAELIIALLACLLVWAVAAPAQSVVSRFFCSRPMMLLGTYSYGLYVYHHFISYYLAINRTEFALAGWIGSHGFAVALQATLGIAASLAVAYVSYEFFEKRFLALKAHFEAAGAHKPREQPAV